MNRLAPGALTPGGPAPRLYYIDMIGPAPPSGLPLPHANKLAISNRHLEYALTWYALAATLFGIFIAFTRSRLRQP